MSIIHRNTGRAALGAAFLLTTLCFPVGAQITDPGAKPINPAPPVLRPTLVNPPPAPVGANTLAPNLGLRLVQAGPGKVLIEKVADNSPVAAAGIKPDDQLLSVAGVPVLSIAAIEERLAQLRPEEKIEVTIYRDNRPITLSIVSPAIAMPTAKPAVAEVPATEANLFGMTLKQPAAGLVVVEKVSPQTPAAAAGAQPGDVLISIEGHPAKSLDDLTDFAEKLVTTDKTGSPLRIEVSRDGKTGVLVLPSTQASASRNVNIATVVLPAEQGPAVLGLVLRDVSPNHVTVVAVAPNSPAAVAGLAPADVILALGDQPVATVQQFVGVVGMHRIGDIVPLQVERQGKPFISKLPMTPRIVDLVHAGGHQAAAIAGQHIQVLQTEIEAMGQAIKALQLQLNATRVGAAP